MKEQRQHERCYDEAGEFIVLQQKDENRQLINGIICDWSVSGLSIVYVGDTLEVGMDLIHYSPFDDVMEDLIGNADKSLSEKNIVYRVVRCHALNQQVYNIGLKTGG